LEKEILLAEGAKVMLTRNLWTAKGILNIIDIGWCLTMLCIGLVNGSQGVVKKIWFNHGSNPRSHLPAVVFVECEGYTGPQTPAWDGIEPSWVPITPSTASWESKTGK